MTTTASPYNPITPTVPATPVAPVGSLPGGEVSGRIASDPTATLVPTASRRRRGRISRRDIANLTMQLAVMTKSGIDVAGALQSSARQCRCRELAEILSHVHDAVLSGRALSEAIADYEHVFGPTYAPMVAAGEASGEMPEIFSQLAHLQRAQMRLTRSIRSLLTYPILLTTVSVLVILGLVLFVLPEFAKIFADFDAELPVLTQSLLTVADELRTRWWLWGTLSVALVVAAYWYRSSSGGRLVLDRFVLSFAPIREISRSLCAGRSCRLLGLMIENGVPVVESLRLAGNAVRNTRYRQLFSELEDAVINGRGIGETLQQTDIVPTSAGEMISVAEQTGTLGGVTRLIGEHYEEEGEARLREVVSALEPIITVGMGLVIAVVVLAVMLPMFDLSTVAQGH